MKTLITAAEVIAMAQQQEKTLLVGLRSIITPAAQDAAKQYGITIVENSGLASQGEEKVIAGHSQMTVDAALIAQIVGQVKDSLTSNTQQYKLSKEGDPCGLRLIRGEKVVLEDFYIDGQPGVVKMKEILSIKESSQMVSGFMTMEDAVFASELKNDEISYIIAGALTCTINGKKYIGQAGDSFFLPAGTKVTYSTSGITKIFFVVSPKS